MGTMIIRSRFKTASRVRKNFGWLNLLSLLFKKLRFEKNEKKSNIAIPKVGSINLEEIENGEFLAVLGHLLNLTPLEIEQATMGDVTRFAEFFTFLGVELDFLALIPFTNLRKRLSKIRAARAIFGMLEDAGFNLVLSEDFNFFGIIKFLTARAMLGSTNFTMR
jgi:hypothetical protein